MINSNVINEIGSYTISVLGSIGYPSSFAQTTKTFNLKFNNPCMTQTITTQGIETEYYELVGSIAYYSLNLMDYT